MKKYSVMICGLILLSMMISAASASENISINYYQEDIGDVNRYWYGEGEIFATDLGNSFELYKNGNDIVSYTSDAAVINVSEERIQFLAAKNGNELHALFMSPGPEGHGLFTLEFSNPRVSEKGKQNVTISIENAEKVLYLNGPVLLENENIYSEGDFKVIQLETSQNNIKIIYLTKLAYGLFSSIIGISLFGFVLFVLMILRRRTIKIKINRRLQALIRNIPFGISESNNGIEFKLNRKSPSSFSNSSTEKKAGDGNSTVSFRIPREIIAGIFVLMLSYIIYRSLVAMISAYVAEIGIATYLIAGMLAGVGLMMFLLLLSISNEKELNVTMSIFVGGIMLVMFTRLGIIMIPVAILVALMVYGLNKAFFLKLEDSDEEPNE
ncbi:hypothetical protein FTO70_14710 [Methanosarcina sp. KYL-1]|uniref:hypothetical protein n=1 Tax=Methanosarcina sp. KYL-1 TaxID=2602068 RepID=UPI0021014D5D|nr:hypothetical protein [Methanosarcina sp. KYL-1]MCQ1536900.1 hypothetical protein [Methanosarcina sp. KYL-1]